LISLPMVYRPPTHGILIPLPIEYRPPYMVFWPPYPWYFDPLPMVYRPPYPWYFDPLSISWLEMRRVKIPWGFNLPYRGGQFSIKGVNIPWMKIDPGVNLPWGSKYHMTPGCIPFTIWHQ
jgi:hypothetical protein